jgi:flagellar hook-basal body complex protein FliE
MPVASLAAGSYAATSRLLSSTTPSGPSSFADLLKQSVAAVGDEAQKADAQMAVAASGKADLVNVVTAVAESETAVETLVAVRDKVIAAYDDIMRMAI